MDPSRLSAVVKAYDIRGVVPDQLDETLSRATGAAFVQTLSEEGSVAGLVVGYDMRPSSPGLARAFADGAAAAGVDVTLIGLASTDELYCASGLLGLPGAMFTASHNPAQYNGIKLCRAYAAPVGQESGLGRIVEDMAGTEIVKSAPDYLQVRFTTPVMKFVDDAEFWYDPSTQVIQVRSASRLGSKDFGTNRRRIEQIRQALAAR